VAHRLAVDFPARVLKMSVLDIAPTLDMYKRTDMDFARAYYHWFHLIQPSPLPEKMIGGNVLHYLHAKLGGWGSGGTSFIEPEAMAEYERSLTLACQRCTQPVKITAPVQASIWSMTKKAAIKGRKSNVTCWYFGVTEAWSTKCSSLSNFGKRNVQAVCLGRLCRRGISFQKSCPNSQWKACAPSWSDKKGHFQSALVQ
jgi:hypothetical protein